jgi:prevent-host-death family protein
MSELHFEALDRLAKILSSKRTVGQPGQRQDGRARELIQRCPAATISPAHLTDQEGNPSIMREVQTSEAKAHLPQLLEAVEHGEIIITRHGCAIARLMPEGERRQEEIDRAIESIKGLRRRTGKITTHELLSARHEGQTY